MAMSQAPGLSGMPDSGHRSSAATSASCASSSASPTSRTIRASPAISLADSIRKTASMARCASGAVMALDQRIVLSARKPGPAAGDEPPPYTVLVPRPVRALPPARLDGVAELLLVLPEL